LSVKVLGKMPVPRTVSARPPESVFTTEGVVDYDQKSGADCGGDQDEKELKTDPQTESQASDVLLGELVAQMGHPKPVFLFQVLGLHLDMAQLPSQECRRIVRDLIRILSRSVVSDGRSECVGAGERLQGLDLGLLVLFPQNPAE